MNRTLAKCALITSALAVPAVAGDEQLTERGYLLTGELLVMPAGEQGLPPGWSLCADATRDQTHQILRLDGRADVIATGSELVSLMSKSLSTGAGELALAGGEGRLGLGNLALAFSNDGWNVVSLSDDWNGRPVFELTQASRQIHRAGEGFSITGELLLSPTVLATLGLRSSDVCVAGAITLIASPMFEPARPVVANAPAALGVIGPDLIVSTLGSGLNAYGAVGDIGGYSFTTVTCNIGDADAIWIDSGVLDTEHPLIATNIYRYAEVNGAGRIEQIGMAWLKHNFCAGDAPSCGSPYTPNGSCDWLGLFATDTYSASTNGSQTWLGPRSEVNPYTGDFPYPYLNNGCGSTTVICKRIQVNRNDLDPSQHVNESFWGETGYVTTDESLTNGTRNNNYTYRQLAVGSLMGTAPNQHYSLSFTSTTVPQQPALNRWTVSESGVTLVNVDVPGEGRFVLGYKVTDLGGGQHHYEYALLNMNSDRSAQAFEVPLPNGVALSNVGFHDIDYHSGEPYDNADWTSTVNGSDVRWAGEAYAQNVNANALRWSTTYNFRFDADASPTPGTLTITLFKPGTPTTVTVNADVPGGQPCALSTYCTTSVTSNFCQPQIGATGIPSASALNGFTVDVTLGEGQKSGLFFFGLTPIGVPWAIGSSSYRCVASPVQRTPTQSSGGTADLCDGAYSLDWNTWRSTHPTGLGSPYQAGDVFHGQYWFRDPLAVTTSNLTNAVSFTLCP